MDKNSMLRRINPHSSSTKLLKKKACYSTYKTHKMVEVSYEVDLLISIKKLASYVCIIVAIRKFAVASKAVQFSEEFGCNLQIV